MRKTALITGASKRIGRAIALHLAKAGWNIALHYNRSKPDAEKTAADIKALGVRAQLVQADLAALDDAGGLFAEIGKALGAATCLINSASTFKKDAPQNFTSASWGEHMRVHAYAPLVLSRAFAAQCPNNIPGNIINITDGLHGWSMSPVFFTYALSKMALWDATQLLAQNLAPNIRVNAIAPGASLESANDLPTTFAKLKDIAPLKTNSSEEQICAAVSFILSSPSFTGQQILLSGGMHLPHQHQ